MRRYLTIYIFILAGIFVLLSLLGRGSSYVVEKRIWKIYKQQVDIAKDPAVVPGNVFDRIIAEYQEIIAKYPNSAHIPDLYIRLGEVNALRGEYDYAREILLSIAGLYPDKKDLLAEALFKVGETYEAQNNWAQAEQTYMY